MARVGPLTLDAAVVRHLAARDGLTPDEAEARALDTLRLVAAARDEQRARGETPGLRPDRAEHLRRAARARMWLSEVFEASHGAADIPDDHRLLARARGDSRLVHPAMLELCQVVIEPPEIEDLPRKAEITADPAWREAALAAMAPLLARIDRTVPIGDPGACALISREVELTDAPADPRLSLTFPAPGGYDLDACAAKDDDGRCTQPTFAPEWTEVVRTIAVPGRSEPFFTRFGLHLVYVKESLPAQPAGDPATEAALRQAVLDAWRAESLDQTLQQLMQKRAVRMVRPTEDEP